MNKYIKILMIIGVTMFSLTSCSDYLETNPSTSVADNTVFNTTQGAQSALYGCYFQFESGTGGTNRSDDWGYPTHQMTVDVDGEDVIARGWYYYDYSYWGHTRGDIFKTYALWTFYYRLINNTNSVITYIDDATGTQQDKDYIKGQALALRGFAYFNLIRFFQQTYAIAKDMPGVPIYTTPTNDKTEGNPRGTVQDTYDQILSDLTQAETLLTGYTRTNATKNHIDKQVCEGILAEVYLTMNKWDEAADYAHTARTGYPLTSNKDYLSGFNDLSTSSWLWGIPQTKDQQLGDSSPFSMWSNWNRSNRGAWQYNSFFLNDLFVNLFNDGDIRKDGDTGNDSTNPVKCIHVYAGQWLNSSWKFRDNQEYLGSMVIMRSEVLLLDEIEALARGGNELGAKNLLWQLQDLRHATRTVSTGEDLISDILKERRKELYGEGFAWFDLKRCELGLKREGAHQWCNGQKVFGPYSWRFVYQLPTTEIANNKALNDGIWPAGDQTPFDGDFTPHR
ncbi:MAG: RagB/SusD family nutrient uptake outer membrane protein [Bacteroidales bacterium]